jgi:hypothetical protein
MNLCSPGLESGVYESIKEFTGHNDKKIDKIMDIKTIYVWLLNIWGKGE